MGLKYLSLDQSVRELMVEEFNLDINSDNCYTSKRFHDVGRNCYLEIMPKHLKVGTDDSLDEDLKHNACFNTHETTKTGQVKSVPINASQVFAEGEFNRFYMRGVAIKAIRDGSSLEVYRARYSEIPNPESEAMVGKSVDPNVLLNDLRECKGLETTLGLPRPNSGLSVKFVK